MIESGCWEGEGREREVAEDEEEEGERVWKGDIDRVESLMSKIQKLASWLRAM